MISLRKLLKLNEEHLGETDNGYGVYRNPKSIKRMDSYLRAISFPNGDLYVVDDGSHVIHPQFSDWLETKGYKIPVDIGLKIGIVKGIIKGYISWQRKGTSNDFYLSESTDFTDAKFDKDKLMPYLEKYSKKVKQKNPKINFKLIRITDA